VNRRFRTGLPLAVWAALLGGGAVLSVVGVVAAVLSAGRSLDVDGPSGRTAVQIDLVDGLARAGVAQLRRAVRGADQQRHAAVRRLEDRGM